MGLIAKAGSLEPSTGLAFSDFVNKYKLRFCAVFEKDKNAFYIKNSIGFDGSSIISSCSTADFWDGICSSIKELNIFARENGTLKPLLQLFSFAQKDDIAAVSIFRLSQTKILMVCNQSFPKECTADLDCLEDKRNPIRLGTINHLITSKSKVIKMQIDFKDAADSFVQAQVIDRQRAEIFRKSVYNEISNRFLCFFAKHVSFCPNEHTVRAIFVVTRDLTKEHLINHIILNLSGVIGRYAEKISCDISGSAVSIPEIKEFLQDG